MSESRRFSLPNLNFHKREIKRTGAKIWGEFKPSKTTSIIQEPARQGLEVSPATFKKESIESDQKLNFRDDTPIRR